MEAAGIEPADRADQVTVKVALLRAVPPGVVMLNLPVVAPPGTVIWTFVVVRNVADKIGTPLRLIAVAPMSPVPVMVTVEPGGPLAGLKEVIFGTGQVTVKGVGAPPVPPAFPT